MHTGCTVAETVKTQSVACLDVFMSLYSLSPAHSASIPYSRLLQIVAGCATGITTVVNTSYDMYLGRNRCRYWWVKPWVSRVNTMQQHGLVLLVCQLSCLLVTADVWPYISHAISYSSRGTGSAHRPRNVAAETKHRGNKRSSAPAKQLGPAE
jgi:hypothetical protein